MLVKFFLVILLFPLIRADLTVNAFQRNVIISNEENVVTFYNDLIPSKSFGYPLDIEEYILTSLIFKNFTNGSTEWNVRLTSLVLDGYDDLKTTIIYPSNPEVELILRYRYGQTLKKIFKCRYSVDDYIGEFTIIKSNLSRALFHKSMHWRIVKESNLELDTSMSEDLEIFLYDCNDKHVTIIIILGCAFSASLMALLTSMFWFYN